MVRDSFGSSIQIGPMNGQQSDRFGPVPKDAQMPFPPIRILMVVTVPLYARRS
jgi:hypothetical protein